MRDRLARDLRSESKAYGYTLSVWGSGALLVRAYGTPSALLVFAYVGGALLAFAALSAVAFDSLTTELDTDDARTVLVVSNVHLLASFGNLVVAYGLLGAFRAVGLAVPVAFLAVGLQASLLYNLLLQLEHAVTRLLA